MSKSSMPTADTCRPENAQRSMMSSIVRRSSALLDDHASSSPSPRANGAARDRARFLAPRRSPLNHAYLIAILEEATQMAADFNETHPAIGSSSAAATSALSRSSQGGRREREPVDDDGADTATPKKQ